MKDELPNDTIIDVYIDVYIVSLKPRHIVIGYNAILLISQLRRRREKSKKQ